MVTAGPGWHAAGPRPWKIFGKGPAQAAATQLSAQGFNEGKPFGAQDIRFVVKGNMLYANALGWPVSGQLLIASLATGSPHYPQCVGRIDLLGSASGLAFEQTAQGPLVQLPTQKPNELAYAFRIVAA